MSGPCSVCAYTLGMLGYPLLSCRWVLKLLSLSAAWNPLPCWASPLSWCCLEPPSLIPSPLNKRRGSVWTLSWSRGCDPIWERDRAKQWWYFTYYLIIARIKVGLWLVSQSAVYNLFYVLLTTIFMSWLVGEKVIIFLSNFPWQEMVFSWFSGTGFSTSCRYPCLPGIQMYLVFSDLDPVWGSPFSCKYFCVSGTWFYLGFSFQSHQSGSLKCSFRLQNPSMVTSIKKGLHPWL